MSDRRSATNGAGARSRPAAHRYGAVFAVTLVAVVFVIAAPSGDWSRAFALALEFAALAIAVATSRDRVDVRRARTLAVIVVAALVVLWTGLGFLPAIGIFAIGGLLGLVIPMMLVGGLVRLLRTQGVTIQAVAGALAIYLYVGLLFSAAVGIVGHSSSRPYFTNGSDGTQSQRVYYSFTTMTTTGYGDFTPAMSAGRSIAVIEMLVGQLYLVTVIGILVGNMAARNRPAEPS
ncbi:MAG: potassium channel family protein [Gaiellaceae bacterium]